MKKVFKYSILQNNYRKSLFTEIRLEINKMRYCEREVTALSDSTFILQFYKHMIFLP